MPLKDAFKRFSERVVTGDLAQHAAVKCGLGIDDARFLLTTYANEAVVGLDLIAPLLREDMRVLEVGSGISLLSGFLAESGFNITGIEPSASGFGFMSEMASAIGQQVATPGGFKPLPITAQQLNPSAHGHFNLIFSVNVVEHIDGLDAAVRSLSGVLASGGQMVHLCPNYTVPYEPHFGVPLVPGIPAVTRFLFPHVLRTHPGLWASLNFVTAGRIRRIARKNDLMVEFDRGVMANAVRRLAGDATYRDRHTGVLSRIGSMLASPVSLRILDELPPALASPMIFRLKHKSVL
jgi:SAM-dependent methyltransferase